MQTARQALAIAALLFVLCVCAQSQEPKPDESGVYSLTDPIKAPTLIHPSAAFYPDDPGSAAVKRSCIIGVVVGPDGTPSDILPSDNEADPFTKAAIEAVKQLHFKPGSLNRKSVPVRVSVWVPFVPDNKHALPEIVPVEALVGGAGKVDRPPTLLKMPEAQLTEEAKRVKFQGAAMISAVISEEGLPEHARILKPLGYGLDAKALEAVANSRFVPAQRYGLPIPCVILFEANFRLY